MAIDVTLATKEDIALVVSLLRDNEAREYAAAGFDTDMLSQALEELDRGPVWYAALDGEPIAIYGVRRKTLLGEVGTPWMMPTELMMTRKVMRAMAKYGQVEVRRVSAGFKHLLGVKIADDAVSIRWLRWLGFTVSDETFDVNGTDFVGVRMDLEA